MEQLNILSTQTFQSYLESNLDKELFELQENIKYVRDFGSGPKDRFSPEYYDFELHYQDTIVDIITKYEKMFMRSL